MRDCDQELCPNWDGHACPCSVLGIGKFDDEEIDHHYGDPDAAADHQED
jgi:hypothetical protein